MPIFCYGILLVGCIAIAIIVYTLVMFGWCGFNSGLPPPRTSGSAAAEGEEQKSLGIQSPYIASSFRYSKGILETPEAAGSKEPAEDECVVCLTGFAEGEFVCQLPRCRHSFHSPCIDMWLYSHSDCPLCRASVDRVDSRRNSLSFTEESSREVLLNIGFLP
ncbi:RING-H2 finger protein ATL39-like [Pistacia vera]|uniref:RING-H2 finger protein ATL39-like n=1 Tax=Pistacia vera TaxID=55513 RepID=UPI001263C2D6|nr:RING-H2 finger protein ATL39-like [Pistacia vera]